jgi:multiple sugar transport system permease protein
MFAQTPNPPEVGDRPFETARQRGDPPTKWKHMTTMSTSATRPKAPDAARPSGPPMRRDKRRWTGLGFVAPFLVVFLVVLIAPVGYSIYLSLFQERMIGGNSFVGIANYTQALNDPNFWDALGRVALFLVVQVPIMLAIALFAALALDSARLHFTAFFRISIFLPYAVPAVVAALMWGFIYGNRFGLVGNVEQATGWDLPDLLSQSWILASIGNIVTWEFVGYNMLLFSTRPPSSTARAPSASSPASSSPPSAARSSSA